MSNHKILIIKGMGLGDIILGMPLLRNLRKYFPESKIYLLNHTGAGREILKNCPYIDEIISLDDAYKGVGYKIKFLSMLRKKKFDLVIDSFPTTNNTALLCSLINAKKTIGFDNNKFSLLYNVRIPFDRRKNIVEIESGILKYLGHESYDKNLELFFEKKDHDLMWKKILGRNISPKDKIICISAGKDIDKIRTWDDKKWAEIGDALVKKYNATVILIGHELDVKHGINITAHMKEKNINLIGKLSLEETVEVLRRAKLLVCINGGAMHLAAALGCKVIALNGSSGYFWDAYSKDAASIRTPLPCMPCESFHCKLKGKNKYKCMREITTEQVNMEIENIMRGIL